MTPHGTGARPHYPPNPPFLPTADVVHVNVMTLLRFSIAPVLLALACCLPAAAGFSEATLEALGGAPDEIDGGDYAAWPDVNGDGWPDLHLGGGILYLNAGDGTFDLAAGMGLDCEHGWQYRMSWSDADGDGDLDCIQSCDLATNDTRTTAVYWFENVGGGFTRSTIHENGMNLRAETPVFFDADGDGDTELYQTVFGSWEPNYARGADRLFESDGPGSWADATAARIPQLEDADFERQSRGAAACDYDGDLDLDLFVPVYGVSTADPSWENLLWRNDGTGQFSDVAEAAGVHIEPHGRYGIGLASGAAWGDFDNDGDFDLVVANIHGRAAIFRNEGDGTFFNTSDENGLPTMQNEWHGVAWIDFDNDGDLDLLLCQWYEHYCHAFENEGPEDTGHFRDVTMDLGLDQETLFRQATCLAVADYDLDGDLDVYMNGGRSADAGRHLLRNDLDPGGGGDHWLAIRLEGEPAGCGTDAVGASARLVLAAGMSGARLVESSAGDGVMNWRTLHFGLGDLAEVEAVLVSWPYHGVERFDPGAGVDRLLTLRQGEGTPVQGLLVVTGPGPAPANPPLVRVWSALAPGGPLAGWEAYGVSGYGTNVACADLDGDGADEVLTGPGPGNVLGPHVRAFTVRGSALAQVSFLAYGTNRYGVNVAGGDLDGDGMDEIVTGAGPGAVFGPHVRGWNVDGGMASSMAGMSYFAYGTPKWGVNVACGDLDGDGMDEVVTGAGPGAVYGPHVRGWNVDGGAAAAIPEMSFFAYGTLKYGVNVACGDLDGDGVDEIVTGAGPGLVFGTHVRGWSFDGSAVAPLSAVNFMAYDGAAWGASVACGDLDGDGIDELLTMPGPDPDWPAHLRAWNVDGESVEMMTLFNEDCYTGLHLDHGGRLAAGDLH